MPRDNTPTTLVHEWHILVVHRWDIPPQETALVADSCCAKHDVAHQVAHRRVPFLMVHKRDTEWVPEMGPETPASHESKGIVQGEAIALDSSKTPRWGQNPKDCPFLSNTAVDIEHVPRRGGGVASRRP